MLTTYVWYRQVRRHLASKKDKSQHELWFVLKIWGEATATFHYQILDPLNQFVMITVISTDNLFELSYTSSIPMLPYSLCLYSIRITCIFCYFNIYSIFKPCAKSPNLYLIFLPYLSHGRMNSWCGTRRILMKWNRFLYLRLTCGCRTSSSMSCKRNTLFSVAWIISLSLVLHQIMSISCL